MSTTDTTGKKLPAVEWSQNLPACTVEHPELRMFQNASELACDIGSDALAVTPHAITGSHNDPLKLI